MQEYWEDVGIESVMSINSSYARAWDDIGKVWDCSLHHKIVFDAEPRISSWLGFLVAAGKYRIVYLFSSSGDQKRYFHPWSKYRDSEVHHRLTKKNRLRY